jgi:hypothetical protein
METPPHLGANVAAVTPIKSPRRIAASGDAARVRKLADMAAALQDGSQSCFYITRLTSIKRLCRTRDIALRFTLYLAELTLARIQAAQPPSTDWATDVQPPVAASNLTLATAAVTTMRRYLDAPTPEGLNAVRAVLGQVSQVQSEIVRLMPGKSPVRLIRSIELLLIEDALRCFTASDNAAQAGEWAYQTARVYAERYNPAYGTGLLRESAPFLADIVRFWGEHEG